MKVLYITQSSSAEMFHALSKYFESDRSYPKGAFVGSDKNWFIDYAKKNPDFLQYQYLAESTIAEEAKNAILDEKKLQSFEQKYGVSLWRAALCDRRFVTGKASSYRQDYKPRLNNIEILKRLLVACEKVESFFDVYKPDLVLGFLCVTYVEYLTYLVANHRRIPILNLRPVRIRNQAFLDSGIYDPPTELHEKYYDSNYQPKLESLKIAQNFISELMGKPMLYEGAVPLSKQKKAVSRVNSYGKIIKDILLHKNESHSNHPLPPLLHRMLVLPWHKMRKKYFEYFHPYLKKQELATTDYAFFALHLEPELALLLFAPGYLNQIEVIRSVAYGLPAGMKLVIKDHPVGLHRRSIKFFKKLLEIPNVVLADPYLHTKELIESSKMVVAIGGSVGLEAMVRQKPLLVLGPCATFSMMGKTTMCQKVSDLNFIDQDIRQLLSKYKYNETELLRFLGIQIDISFQINIYSVLLKRKDGYRLEDIDYDAEIERFGKSIEIAYQKVKTSQHKHAVKIVSYV